jgi:hypothetical protein
VSQCGELSWEHTTTYNNSDEAITSAELPNEQLPTLQYIDGINLDIEDVDLVEYKPNVCKATGEWFLSEIDLAFIAEGCGVLGTGMF